MSYLQESFDTILVSKFNACPQTAEVEWNVTLFALDRPDTVPRTIHNKLTVNGTRSSSALHSDRGGGGSFRFRGSFRFVGGRGGAVGMGVTQIRRVIQGFFFFGGGGHS